MLFTCLALIFLFILGACLGSFLNLVIYRTLETEEDWKITRSRCDHCHTQLAWYENLPLLSFLVLGGRCGHCRAPIAASHLWLELTSGLLFVWLGGSGEWFWLVVALAALVIFVADLRYLIIPDWALVVLALATLGQRLSQLFFGTLTLSDFFQLLGVAFVMTLIFGLIWAVTAGRGLGFGDVKLAPVLTLLVGWPEVVVAFFLAVILGAAVGIGLLLTRRFTRKQEIPFGPFLLLGSAIALVWGAEIWAWYWTHLLGL